LYDERNHHTKIKCDRESDYTLGYTLPIGFFEYSSLFKKKHCPFKALLEDGWPILVAYKLLQHYNYKFTVQIDYGTDHCTCKSGFMWQR
jgi:hypothetical protein